MFKVFSHDHDGYDFMAEFVTFEDAFAYAQKSMEEYQQRFGDLRYWRDALIEENGKRYVTVHRK